MTTTETSANVDAKTAEVSGADPKNPETTANREKPEVRDATKKVASDDGTEPENSESPNSEPETFDRAYVEKLRKEAADHRVRAKRADDLARQLYHSRVAALGRLADPDDLEYDEALLEDMPALEAAVEALIERKPHLATRTPRGDVGQGTTGASSTVDLAAMLRGAL